MVFSSNESRPFFNRNASRLHCLVIFKKKVQFSVLPYGLNHFNVLLCTYNSRVLEERKLVLKPRRLLNGRTLGISQKDRSENGLLSVLISAGESQISLVCLIVCLSFSVPRLTASLLNLSAGPSITRLNVKKKKIHLIVIKQHVFM